MKVTVVTFQDNEMEDLVKIFKTLSDTSKIRILSVLDKQVSLSVGDIAKRTGLELSLVSHNLKILKLFGFVKPRKDGKHVFYSIDDNCVIDILQRARDHVAGS
ncbi:MAG: ArsR/SmtB family transcription factor [Candidatus Thorarchaeota archaeon]|jgi:ArsR family transcriptional regulator